MGILESCCSTRSSPEINIKENSDKYVFIYIITH